MTLSQMINEALHIAQVSEEEMCTPEFDRAVIAGLQSWLETPEVAEALYAALTGTGDGPPLHAIVHALQRAAEKGLA